MKIFLAGCDSFGFSRLAIRAKARNLLFSYYHTQAKQSDKSVFETFEIWNQSDIDHVICDSGLFTMMFGVGKGKAYTQTDLEEYTTTYIKTAQSWNLKRLTIVETDVHKILGMQSVFEFRKHFEASGLPVLYVWHIEEGIDGLFRMCEKYDFIALSVPELRKVFKDKSTRYQDSVFDLLSKIKKNCSKLPRIHLLGNTVRETMETELAWSCDSTSWLSSGRYGVGQVFRNGIFQKTAVRSELWKEMTNEFLQSDSEFIREFITKEGSIDYHLGHLTMARQYVKYQEWLDSHFQWIGDRNGN